jgi:hypothetical protein
MAKKKSDVQAQGIELIDLVIERVKADPKCISGFCGDRPLPDPKPLAPEVVERLTFPSGRSLPPSLKRWLAFDASWLADLGWFSLPTSPCESPVFTPRSIDQIVTDEFDELWGGMYEPLGARLDECFLLPGGSDSRRIYAVTDAPDSLGEYPALVIDTDDLPYAAVMYPGFDVFMADEAGFALHDMGTYEDLFEDKRYAPRLNEHARHIFNGKSGIEIMDEEWGGLESSDYAAGRAEFDNAEPTNSE